MGIDVIRPTRHHQATNWYWLYKYPIFERVGKNKARHSLFTTAQPLTQICPEAAWGGDYWLTMTSLLTP